MEYHRQYVFLLLQIIFLVENCFAENLILNINFKKPIAVTNDAFLSFTLDPEVFLGNIDNFTKIERSTNMMRGLAPAYVRFAGPQSNYFFEETDLNNVATNSNRVFSERHWALLYQWAKNAGLDAITCIAPRFIEDESKTHSWDPTNITKFLAFSNQMGYNINWQLGYECQTRCEFSGGDLGRYVTNLRDLLEIYPKYSNALIIGPDIVTYKTTEQQRYLQDYFNSVNDALSAITWHPNFTSIALVNNGNISVQYDNLAAEMDEIYKIIGRTAGNKPLWIAESKPEKYKHQYLGALIWTRRLGNAAKLGVQVVMKQLQDLNKASPDYWVSLLHKTLVGREVLEMRIQHSDNSNIHFYSQCTKPTALFVKGAITIFGVNLTPETVIANLKGLNSKTLHKYILSSDFETGDKMFSEKILLNNKPLNLIDNKKVPDLQPEIIIDSNNLEIKLSSGDIGFWVIPDAKVKACMYTEEETTDVNTVAKKLSKRHENSIQQDNQEEEKDISQSTLKNQKTKQDRRKQKNMENENQQDIWNSKLLGRIRRVLQKKLLRKSDSPNFQRSITVVLKQDDSSEEKKEQSILKNNNFKTADNKLENVRDTPKKYKRSLLEKKDQTESEYIEDLKMENLDNAVTSKIDTLLQLDEEGVTLNDLTMNKLKDEAENEAKVIVGLNGKLKKYLHTLGNFSKNTNVIQSIKKYFYMLFNMLQDNESTQNNDNNQIFVQEDSMEEKRFKRDLNRISDNSRNKILGKRSRIDDLKNVIKRKIFHKKKFTSDNLNNNYDKDKNNCHNLRRQVPVKRFLDNEASAVQVNHHSAQQEFRREKRRKKTNANREYSKIDDNYQSSMQKLERARRDVSKKLAEISLRKETSKKRTRADDVKDYLNERKIKKKDEKEGLLVPFNPRTTESGENTFYGFFRQNPMNNFPEGDIFATTGDSLEQIDKDYDYVDDENDDDVDSLKHKNTQHALDYTENNMSEEDHRDYVPNEFFENVKLSDTKIKGGSKDYGDLWEAQYFSEEQENTGANIRSKDEGDNKRSIAESLEVQYKQPDKVKEKYFRETGMQYDQNAKHEPVQLKRFSTTINQFAETPAYINHTSNVRPEEAKLKAIPESKVSFYQPAQVFAARYGNYQTSTAKYDEAKLSEEKDSIVNMLDSKDDINTKPINFYNPAEYSILNGENERTKRSDWEKLKIELNREMIEEDENNAKDCHCRVIRASDPLKRFCYCRVKRDTHVIPDSSSEIGDVNTDSTQIVRDAENMTKEDYEKIMTGEILPNTDISNSEYDERNTITETIVESSRVDYEPNSTMQTIDTTSTLPMDSSTINISEQNDNAENSTTKPLLADSTLGLSLSSDKSVDDISKKTFFRPQSDVQTENQTHDLPEIDYSISSDSRKDFVPSSVTRASQKSTQEKRAATVEEKETENSIHSTITTNQEEKERHEDNYTSSLKTTISLDEITEGIVKETTTETSLSKRAIDKSIDNSKSNETEISQKLQRDVGDTIKNKSETEEKQLKSKKGADARRMNNMMQKLAKAPLRGLARTEENLIKRAEQIDKRKERLYVKREKLLRQYQQELSQIANEHKRNLKRREAWERFYENDDFHRLIDQGEFIAVLIDNNTSYEDDDDNDDDECNDEKEYDERYVIPIELTSKQYDVLLNQIYPFMKKVRYSKYNRYQFPRQLEVLADEQESAESSSRSDHGIYAIDPSTYHGGEPTLQLYKSNIKSPRYHPQVKSQMQIPNWMLKGNVNQAYIRKPDKDQNPVSKLQEYMKKSPIRDYHDREKSNVLYVLDAQKQSDLPKELARVWLSSIDRRDINGTASDKTQVGSSNTYRNLEEKHDVLDSMPMTDTKTELTRDFDTERNAGDKEFTNVDDGEEDTLNFRTTENTEDAEKITKDKKFENIRLARDMQTEEDITNEQVTDVHNKKEDTLNIGPTKDLTDEKIENIKKTEDFDVIKEEMLNARSRKAKTKRLNRKNKNVENKDTEINKTYNSNEVKEDLNIKMSNNNEADVETVTDVDIEPSELEEGITRTRRNIKKSSNNKYLQQPYFLLTRDDARNGPNRDIHIYLKKHSEEIFNKQPVNHIFLRKMSDSTYDDNSSEDFEVPVELSGFLTKRITDLINENLDNEILEELENYETLLFLSNLLNKTATDISHEEIYSESEQEISVDDEDTRINYQSRKKDEQYESRSEESDKYSEMKDKTHFYKNPIQSHKRGMLLLFPRRNERRRRRQIESEICDENINEIKDEPRKYKSILAQNPEDKSAEYHLNDDINKINIEELMKMKNKRTNYFKSKMDKRNHDNLLEEFIKARKNNNLHSNEISFFIRNSDKDKNTKNNILKSDEKVVSLLEEPISTVENLIIKSNKSQDLTQSLEQSADNNFEEKNKETFALDGEKHSKNATSETNSNYLIIGFIQKLFAFFSELSHIFI